MIVNKENENISSLILAGQWKIDRSAVWQIKILKVQFQSPQMPVFKGFQAFKGS